MKILKTTILFVLTGVLLWLSLKNLEFSKLKEDWGSTNLPLLLLSAFIGILSHVVRAERWKLMLGPLGYQTSLLRNFYAVMVGYFINLAIPRGGELSRCVSLNRTDKVPINTSLGSVVAERIVDLILMVLLIGVTLILEFSKLMEIISGMYTVIVEKLQGIPTSKIIVFVAILLFVFLVFYLLYKKGKFNTVFLKVKEFGKGLKDGLFSVFKVKRLGLFLLHSVIIWVLYYLMTYIGLKALPATENIGMLAALTVFVAGGIAMVVPLPGGTGSYHVIVPVALSLYAISDKDGLSFATIFHMWQTLTIIVVGAISLLLSQTNSKNATS